MLFRKTDAERSSPRDDVSALFGDWYAPLLRYAWRAAGSLDAAEDLVQEAFMELYRALAAGKRVENPRAWTLCVVRRRIVDRQREQHRRGGPMLSLSDIGDVAEQPAEAPVEWEGDRRTELLRVLSRREEEVLLLRSKGLKYRQISAALEIGTNSVKTLLARGIRKMQQASGAAPRAPRVPKHDDDGIPETLQ